MTQAAVPKKPVPRLVVNAGQSSAQSGGSVKPQAIAAMAATQKVASPHAATVAPSASSANPIATFIELEIEARQCSDLDALRFAIVNSPRKLAPYDQAFLIEPLATGGWKVTRAASVHKIDRNAPQMRSIGAWLQALEQSTGINHKEPRLADLGRDAADWNLAFEDLPYVHAAWLPFVDRGGRVMGVLLALKKEAWIPQSTSLLMPLCCVYAHAWAALEPQKVLPAAYAISRLTRSRLSLGTAFLLLAAAFVPVPMSSLAPAEIVARDPILVTAPIDGVIDAILPAPGAWVEKDALILKFVDVKLRNDYEVAKRNEEVAHARYFKVVQMATALQKDIEELAVARTELDVSSAELDAVKDMLARAEVRAAKSGLLMYSSKSEWLGRPVRVGERIMEIGDPDNIELKIELPVSDAISLRNGSVVALFLDGNPLNSIEGEITRTNYRPTLTADRQLVYVIHAKLAGDALRRIGLRGVARVSADMVPLWFYLFRRPVSGLRQRLGL